MLVCDGVPSGRLGHVIMDLGGSFLRISETL